MKNFFLSTVLWMMIHTAYSQTWQLLPNSPSAGFRHDDLFFINLDTGWVVNVDGYIYRTNDGGINFITQLYQPSTTSGVSVLQMNSKAGQEISDRDHGLLRQTQSHSIKPSTEV